ncbi:hypothetical protein HZB02_01690 [Candidatus Woesearchaeota archaeon]|nr:hypothetical protein [Candidatus Woesearchaeota archaeon]
MVLLEMMLGIELFTAAPVPIPLASPSPPVVQNQLITALQRTHCLQQSPTLEFNSGSCLYYTSADEDQGVNRIKELLKRYPLEES